MRLRCEEIRKAYRDTRVLDGVALEASPGSITAIIGPNGAGKTTLLRILALLEAPDGGRIFFDGINTREARAKLRRHVVMVFQNPILLDRSLEANVAYGLKARGRRDVRVKVETVVSLLGLAHLRKRNARTLSGGEKKRTALGMALALDPPILLLDECFANLDPLSTKVAEDLLLSLKRRGEQTIILTTHSLAHAQAYGDFVYLLKDGRIVEKGKAEDVFHKPSSLYAAQYVGRRNVFPGQVEIRDGQTYVRLDDGVRVAVVTELKGKVYVAIDPTDILVSTTPLVSSALNTLEGTITAINVQDPLATIVVDAGVPLEAVVTRRSLDELNLERGGKVHLTWKASAVHVFAELAGS